MRTLHRLNLKRLLTRHSNPRLSPYFGATLLAGVTLLRHYGGRLSTPRLNSDLSFFWIPRPIDPVHHLRATLAHIDPKLRK